MTEKERRMREALEHLAHPNWHIRPTGQDARDMAAYAARVLAEIDETFHSRPAWETEDRGPCLSQGSTAEPGSRANGWASGDAPGPGAADSIPGEDAATSRPGCLLGGDSGAPASASGPGVVRMRPAWSGGE